MYNGAVNGAIVFFLTVSMSLLSSGPLQADPYSVKKYSPISLKIELPKDTYAVGERIDAKIVVSSTRGGGYPATFNIRLYHGKDLFDEYRTNFPRIFMGRTEYALNDFGIPPFNDSPAAVGDWNISILQQDLDVSNAAWATIHVVMPEREE